MVTARAPGRCTLVGEHVDYAGGRVLCCPIDRSVGVALRASADGRWRLASDGRSVDRAVPEPAGDLGDRAFAPVVVLRRRGLEVPPCEVAVAADLPEGAGLSSSAALSCAVTVALLRLLGRRVSAAELARIAFEAEHDVVGVPCGPLDQRAVVGLPQGGAMLLDLADGSAAPVAWGLRAAVLVACDTGEAHDVGGAGYRTRRAEAADALRLLGVDGIGGLGAGAVDAAGLPSRLDRRAHHLVSETARATAAAAALAAGDAVRLGELMSASHASLRDDYEVSTPALDAAVAAAREVTGCHGARLVGAGFGGTAIALVEDPAAERCAAAMLAAAPRARGAWRLGHAPGLAITATDVIAD